MAIPSPILPNTTTPSQADYPRTQDGKRNYAWSAVHPHEARPSAATIPECEGGFSDLVDIINPLQHIPIVSNIYRAMTGDTISAAGQMIGGMLFGGPIGFLAGAASALFSEFFDGEGGTAVAEAKTRLEKKTDLEIMNTVAPNAPTADVAALPVDAIGGGVMLGAGYGFSNEARAQVNAYLNGKDNSALVPGISDPFGLTNKSVSLSDDDWKIQDIAALNSALGAYAKSDLATHALSSTSVVS